MRKRSHSARAQRGARSAPARARRPAAAAAGATRGGRASGSSARTKRAARTAPERGAAQTGALALPAECTLSDANGLKLKLAALLNHVKAVTVDVSAVRRIDTASLQLIAAFARDRRAGELPVELAGESAAFAEGVRLLGLAQLLGDAA